MVLTGVIGLEREAGAKSAGLRTHTLVGVGSAVFMLVSKYGFADLLGIEQVSIDPSRVAAQVVSGIGFIGGGLIFVRQDVVRGLTTAATVWVAAAVGMACGAGLPVLGIGATAVHFLVARGFPPLSRIIRRLRREPPTLYLSYVDGRGVLRTVLSVCTERGWSVQHVSVERASVTDEGQRIAAVTLLLEGRGEVSGLAGELAELPGVRSAAAGHEDPVE
ncbi:MgtC/SapB family protein [Pseudonocardia asaccharolytica]